MVHLKKKLPASVVAAALLAAVSLAGVSSAHAQQSPEAAQPAAPSGPSSATTPHHRHDPAASVEKRISDLHKKLQITDAQEPQWNAVAQTMRDNAKATFNLVQQKRQQQKDMTAVEDLRAYQQIAETHAEGVKKLADAFEALYATMSDPQKKTADEVFQKHRRHARHRG